MKTIAIAAAGTGGHVFPALALAEALIAAGYQVIWLGSEHGLDARLIPSTSIPFLPLPMKGVRRRSLLGWIKMPLLLGSSVWKAWRILKKNQAKGVIVFGGYVSVPAGIAAFLSRLPLWIHEQNAIAGLSNRILSPIAQKIYCGFEGAFVGQKVAVVGNPIRSNLLNLPDKSECPASPLHLLVMGGSQGASFLNETVPKALSLIRNHGVFSVLHQAGEKTLTAAKEAYQKAGIVAEVVPFITDMQTAYLQADVVICRAGALTVSEVAATGNYAIFIPLPTAVDDHQRYNAETLVVKGAADMLLQSECTPECLAKMLSEVLAHPKQCRLKGGQAKRLANTQAVQKMIRDINEY